jgi:hypothetical protein
MWQERIEKLHVRGFKTFADATIDLKSISTAAGLALSQPAPQQWQTSKATVRESS